MQQLYLAPASTTCLVSRETADVPTVTYLGRRAPAKTTRYLAVSEPGHPLAMTDGRVYVHRAVLFEKLAGTEDLKCNWCQRELTWFGDGKSQCHSDHLDGDTWNNDPNNLVPSCMRCNWGRARRADFLTHCPIGHPWAKLGESYYRPDGGSRQCRRCLRLRGRAAVLAKETGARRDWVAMRDIVEIAVRAGADSKIVRPFASPARCDACLDEGDAISDAVAIVCHLGDEKRYEYREPSCEVHLHGVVRYELLTRPDVSIWVEVPVIVAPAAVA